MEPGGDRIKKDLSFRFRMKDLVRLHHFLGIEVLQSPGGEVVWFGQPTFTENLLKKYEMQHAKPAATASAADSKLVKRKDDEEGVDLSSGSRRSALSLHQNETGYLVRGGERSMILR